ncbi:MAG: 16S rRNA (uracil(1498)-N(3))-methyltransferase [Alphaproteobacteria bacterium]
MPTTKPRIRLYVSYDLGAGAAVGLDRAQTHYVRTVMRASLGDRVALFNGRDGEWLAEIEGLGKGRCSLGVRERRRAQRSEPDLWLAFAPVKGARLDFIAQKATELGVSRLMPVKTERTQVARVNVDRLRANAVEAAEQSERLSVPRVESPVVLRDLLAEWPENRRLLLADESGGGAPIGAAVATAGEGKTWGVLVGPEGGFSAGELDRLRPMPFVTPVGLGPRVLRSDTAALAALAVLQAVAGDWRAGRT